MTKLIPKSMSRAEEAAFWDDTNLTDVLEQLERVHVDSARKPAVTFALRLDPDVLSLVREVARREEVGPTQLVRSWILERLRLEASVGSLAQHTSGYPDEMEQRLRQKVVDQMVEALPQIGEQVLQDLLAAET